MRTRHQHPSWLAAAFAILLTAASGLAQGTFQNLNFESGQIPNGTRPGSSLPISSALPGWTGSLYITTNGVTMPVDQVLYDPGALAGGPFISVLDKQNQGYQPLQGNYTVELIDSIMDLSLTISQAGLIPAGAKSILMDAQASRPFTVSLGGQNINMVPLQTFPSYTQYAGDVSAYAGQPAQLGITVPPGSYSVVLVDDISFVIIPEPGFCALAALGTLLVSWRMRLSHNC